ncbi:PAS-domain containing protein [Roseomonas xinghualingensis]|uniref:PAS-domain containing protein n=1 Tax=Roseomonas xinghualingensis TaxID=2986475 RepID=UPI0021F1D0E5|nr:PAS-domain containing protein [Roseomonas sp. SXEYE001]MCV4208809.1 PAS-domain containing protein [Roseomonas sp. SXEYE001]
MSTPGAVWDPLPRSVLDALPVGLAVYDAEARLVYATPAFWAQAGKDVAALPPGTPQAEVTDLFTRSGHYSPDAPEEGAAAAANRGHPQRRLARNDAGRWYELTSTPLPHGGSVSLSVDVTGDKCSRPEAVEHAALLETILQRLDTGIMVTDHLARVTCFNEAYPRLIGVQPGVLRVGMTRAELLDHLRSIGELSQLTPEEQEGFDQVEKQGTADFACHRPNGATLRIRARPLLEGGVLTEVDDITPLRKAEQASQERAQLLDGVLSALPHGVCVYGPDRRVRLVNAAYQRIMAGCEVKVGDHHTEIARSRIASGEYEAEAAAALMRLQEDFGNPEPYERTRARPNGTVVSVRAVHLLGGGLVVVVTDVTARARAEAEAEQRAATLRAMLDNQLDGVALFDRQGYLIAANALAARMTGLSEEDMSPGRHLLDLRARQISAHEFGRRPEDQQAFVEARGQTPLETGKRYIRRRPDGTLLEVGTDLTSDGGFIRTYRDVTEDRRIRAELEAARDAAEAASRTKSDFLATMTHELRTPLHAVIGFSEAILEETKPERMRAHAEEVLAAGKQLLGLVDGLLEATRIEAGSLSLHGAVFDPAPLLRAVAAPLRKAAKEGRIAFEFDVPDALPPMRGDEGRMRQVLSALLSNALKFTPEGGRVTLSAAPTGDGGSIVTIRDTGIGMAPEDIPRAFEAFTQLEAGLTRRYPGSGLGLYLARALAGAMGLALTLESAPGQGTTARLALPPAEEIPG